MKLKSALIVLGHAIQLSKYDDDDGDGGGGDGGGGGGGDDDNLRLITPRLEREIKLTGVSGI